MPKPSLEEPVDPKLNICDIHKELELCDPIMDDPNVPLNDKAEAMKAVWLTARGLAHYERRLPNVCKRSLGQFNSTKEADELAIVNILGRCKLICEALRGKRNCDMIPDEYCEWDQGGRRCRTRLEDYTGELKNQARMQDINGVYM